MKNLIWYEKYRPRKLSKLALDNDTKTFFEDCINQGEIPHIMLYGPAGSGKTTISKILIDNLAANRLILNASSSDRGIGTIKTQVKHFASSTPMQKGKMNIVFFDEADGLTSDAQNALKNTIEQFHKNCRFIFTCNNIDRITEPILSRCQCFHFDSIPKDKVKRICFKILKKEKIKFGNSKDELKELIDRYYPDVRSIINNLQSSCVGGKFKFKVLDRVDVNRFPKYMNKGKIFALRNMWSNTVDFTRLYKYLFNDYSAETKDVNKRAEMMMIIAEYMYKDKTIADREINFAACCLEIMSLKEVKFDFKSKE